MASEVIPPELIEASMAIARLIENGAPDSVVEAGRMVCRHHRLQLPIRAVDKATLIQYAQRRGTAADDVLVLLTLAGN